MNYFTIFILISKLITIFQVILEEPEAKSFGIKHSPYVGQLKGDDWVSARTELQNLVAKGNENNGVTANNTRTHSDGTRVRTETFSYSTQAPTVRTTTTTKSSSNGPTIRTSTTQQVSQAAFLKKTFKIHPYSLRFNDF